LNTAFLVERMIAAGLIILISFPVHEFSHALAAYRLGDSTAKLFGRLTLNPVVHFDPLGGILLIVSSLIGFGIGWAKPTPVNVANLQGGRNGDAIVAMSGPVSNLIIAAVVALPLRYIESVGIDVPVQVLNVMALFIYINIALCLFNLLPVVPLDGSHVLFAVMSPQTAWRYRPVLTQYGPIMLLVAAFLPILPGGQTIFGAIFDAIGQPIFQLLVGREFFFWTN
jgi:Zn-dependent protease